MRNDVVFIVLTLASKRASDYAIIAGVHERLGVRLSLADVETILIANEWMEVAA